VNSGMIDRRILKWFEERIGWRLLAFVLAALLFIGVILVQTADEDTASVGSNLLVFSLVNLTVLVLLVLIFLVGRNVVKLIFERRRGILGARLRSRLLAAFLLLLSFPMAVSFVTASGLLSDALEGWFSGQVEGAVSGAVEVAREHIGLMKTLGRSGAQGVVARLKKDRALLSDRDRLDDFLQESRKLQGLFSLQVVSSAGTVLGLAENAAAGVELFREPELDPKLLRSLSLHGGLIRVEERGARQFIRAYEGWESVVVVASFLVDPEIVLAQSKVNDAFREYEQLRLFRHPLKTSYVLTLAMVSLLSLFGAIWVAFFIAKQLLVPIQLLAEGTQAVARGNYDFRIKNVRDDEMGFLVRSFNTMIEELKGSRATADRRKRLMESILGRLQVGIITVDRDLRVTSLNAAAQAILEMTGDAPANLHDVQSPLFQRLCELVRRTVENPDDSEAPSEETRIDEGDRIIVATTGRITAADEGNQDAYVVILDDVTELSKAQHHEAWRDVARRIAHEIKNPLTPLQLSAQRLKKLLGGQEGSESVRECTDTIVEYVSVIARLANEFGKYARMPTAEFALSDLNGLVSSVVLRFAANHPAVVFQCIADNKIPVVHFDVEQIRALLVNLLDNALSAVSSDGRGAGRIDVRTVAERGQRRYRIEVVDNGPGIPPAERIRIFEPYFTTKKGGTGLGLAIVTSIVLDHQGTIRVEDASPHGARFVVILPERPQPAAAKRLLAEEGR
jgi:two-component system, NtrC family, nitrogen regulation sensor histidine kinase NtrY